MHLRGLIIDDQQGRARILIGAPVPAIPGRKRNDRTVGLLVLGENGTDRVAIGAPTPNPQTGGKVGERIGDAVGIEVNDNEGNERGGLAMLDNDGRMVLGLDYPSGGGGEAITLAVLPGEGPSFQLKDTSSLVRAGLVLGKDSAAKLYGVNWRDKSSLDLSVRLRHIRSDKSSSSRTRKPFEMRSRTGLSKRLRCKIATAAVKKVVSCRPLPVQRDNR